MAPGTPAGRPPRLPSPRPAAPPPPPLGSHSRARTASRRAGAGTPNRKLSARAGPPPRGAAHARADPGAPGGAGRARSESRDRRRPPGEPASTWRLRACTRERALFVVLALSHGDLMGRRARQPWSRLARSYCSGEGALFRCRASIGVCSGDVLVWKSAPVGPTPTCSRCESP